MSINRQYQAYQNNAIQTASKGQLTLMLYNGCIKFIKQAMKDIEEHHFERKNTHIQKAQAIIQELMLTLDRNTDISKQLLPLYEYIYFRLQEANIKNEKHSLEEALEFVIELRDMWKEVMKKATPQKYTQGAQV